MSHQYRICFYAMYNNDSVSIFSVYMVRYVLVMNIYHRYQSRKICTARSDHSAMKSPQTVPAIFVIENQFFCLVSMDSSILSVKRGKVNIYR